jgi:nucleoside-diphosphate-sugar epimerase
MRTVITGGAGFLGSHLCDKLIEQGHDVICIDNLCTGSKNNIRHLLNSDRFTFIDQDVCEKFPDWGHIDQIYHLASPASPNINSPKSYHALGMETMKANTMGTWKLAEEAVKQKAVLLFASTSEIYGEPLEHPQKESYRGNVSTTGPRSVYDEAKRFGETIIAAFIRYRSLRGKIVRIFNTYGPRMAADDGRVVTEFIRAAKQNNDIPIHGDGTQTRSFCYVSDLVTGLTEMMNSNKTEGEIFNLGNPLEFTILDLAKKIILLTKSSSKIIIKEKRPVDDPTRRCPDISKARKILGWEPKINLDEGLKKTLDAWKKDN